MYAIIESGSKQYKISKGDRVELERLSKKKGSTVKLEKVLLVSDGKKVEVGTPYLKNVTVSCEVLGDIRTRKVISFKYRKRKDSRVKIGHRQGFTALKIKEIKLA